MDLLRLGCALFAMAGVTFSNFSAHAEVTRSCTQFFLAKGLEQ